MAQASAPSLVLASASPRRAQLLARLGVHPALVAADIDETPIAGESAADLVRRLSIGKAQYVVDQQLEAGSLSLVVGGDTVVLAPGGSILGKPSDDSEARAMLGLLSGVIHHVVSGIAIIGPGAVVESAVQVTTVWMRRLSESDLDWYIGTGEHIGKAGAYAIQGAASVFVERTDGDYHSIMGLPVALLNRLLGRFDSSLSELGTS